MTNQTITRPEFVALMNQIAQVTGSRIFERYSGQAMYGAQCWGIECSRSARRQVATWAWAPLTATS